MKNKHLTLGDRETIGRDLREGLLFKAIACEVGKDPMTIVKTNTVPSTD